MRTRLTSWWRLAVVLAAIGIAATVLAILLPRVWESTQVGAASPQDAVTAYVEALNTRNAEALRALSPTAGPTLDAGIQRRLAEYGDRGIRLASREVEPGPTPHQASARLVGVLEDSRPYHERLFMNRGDDDRWYVNLHDLPTPTGAPVLPTAGTDRPQR